MSLNRTMFLNIAAPDGMSDGCGRVVYRLVGTDSGMDIGVAVCVERSEQPSSGGAKWWAYIWNGAEYRRVCLSLEVLIFGSNL